MKKFYRFKVGLTPQQRKFLVKNLLEMKTLNKEQRKFLEYIRDTHKGIGWKTRIERILQERRYVNSDAIPVRDKRYEFNIYGFLETWKEYTTNCKNSRLTHTTDNKPIKYLK